MLSSERESSQGWDEECFSLSDFLKGNQTQFALQKTNDPMTITLRAKSPFKTSNSYYEVKIEEIGSTTVLTMGFAIKQFPR